MLMKALTRPELDLRANERLVALVILSFADMQTLTCYPSIDEICRRARVGRNTTTDAIKNLRVLGLVNVAKRRSAGGKFARNEYDFNPLRKHITVYLPKYLGTEYPLTDAVKPYTVIDTVSNQVKDPDES